MKERDYKKLYEKMTISKDMQERIRQGVQRQKGHSYKWVRVAAAVVVLCLVVGGSVSATIRSGNLFSFLSADYNISKQANHLVEQSEKFPVVDNEYLTCTMKEALCDENTVYCMAEVQVKNPDKYFLLDAKYGLNDYVDVLEDKLKIDGMKGKTIAQYLKEIKKKPLRISAYVKSAELEDEYYDGMFMKTDIRYGKGGKAFLYMCAEDENETLHNIDFHLIGWNPRYDLLKIFENKEELAIQNQSEEVKEYNYKIKEEYIGPEKSIKVTGIHIMETELGLYATVETEEPGKESTDSYLNDHCSVNLADSTGKTLKTVMESWWSQTEEVGRKCKTTTRMHYEKTDLSQGLTLVLEGNQGKSYGPYSLVESK